MCLSSLKPDYIYIYIYIFFNLLLFTNWFVYCCLLILLFIPLNKFFSNRAALLTNRYCVSIFKTSFTIRNLELDPQIIKNLGTMLRRPPTAIELKLDDIVEFEQLRRKTKQQDKLQKSFSNDFPPIPSGIKTKVEVYNRIIGYSPNQSNGSS